jgi:hypothetical protein
LLLRGIEALPLTLTLLCGTDGLMLGGIDGLLLGDADGLGGGRGNPHTSLIFLRHIVASM